MENNKIENSKQNGNSLNNIKEIGIGNELKQLRAEINYAAKALDSSSGEIKKSFSELINDLEAKTIALKVVIEQQQGQTETLSREFSTFALLPDKLAKQIKALTPSIAIETNKIYKDREEELISRCKLFENQITCVVTQVKHEFASVANDFANRITEEGTDLLSNNKKKFFKMLGVVVVFSALVSGITSYTVANYFPRYVEITGARDLTVTNSKVEVWGKSLNEKLEGKK